jgi:hypothetical protein
MPETYVDHINNLEAHVALFNRKLQQQQDNQRSSLLFHQRVYKTTNEQVKKRKLEQKQWQAQGLPSAHKFDLSRSLDSLKQDQQTAEKRLQDNFAYLEEKLRQPLPALKICLDSKFIEKVRTLPNADLTEETRSNFISCIKNITKAINELLKLYNPYTTISVPHCQKTTVEHQHQQLDLQLKEIATLYPTFLHGLDGQQPESQLEEETALTTPNPEVAHSINTVAGDFALRDSPITTLNTPQPRRLIVEETPGDTLTCGAVLRKISGIIATVATSTVACSMIGAGVGGIIGNLLGAAIGAFAGGVVGFYFGLYLCGKQGFFTPLPKDDHSATHLALATHLHR